MRMIAIWIVAGLAGLFAAVWALGAMMPEEHTATVTAYYAAPPDAVWKVISDPGRFTEWRSGLSNVTVDGNLVTEHHQSFGEMSYRITALEPPRRLITSGAGGPEQGFTGDWIVDLTPHEKGTRLTITENGRVFSRLFRVLSKYVFGHETTMRRYHADLARRLHSSGT